MIKLIFWGILAFLGYTFYLKPKLDAGDKQDDILDDEDYVTVKISKKEKSKSDKDYSDFEEIE